MLGGPGDLLVIPALEGGDWSCNGDWLTVSKIRWRSIEVIPNITLGLPGGVHVETHITCIHNTYI